MLYTWQLFLLLIVFSCDVLSYVKQSAPIHRNLAAVVTTVLTYIWESMPICWSDIDLVEGHKGLMKNESC